MGPLIVLCSMAISSLEDCTRISIPLPPNGKRLGYSLAVLPEQLDLIERKPSNRDDSDYLRDMLHYRQSRTELTWEVIYRALLSSIVGESKLAKRIAQDHCPYLLESRGADLHIGQEAADNVFAMTGRLAGRFLLRVI